MKYGTMNVDFEDRVNFERLRNERLAKARASLQASDLGSLLCYDFDNIRYITGTTIGEWARNKMNRYCILPRDGEPLLFDPAAAAKRKSCPWIVDRLFPAVGSMRGAIPP
jgi:Xaa-Pro dipeptidase